MFIPPLPPESFDINSLSVDVPTASDTIAFYDTSGGDMNQSTISALLSAGNVVTASSTFGTDNRILRSDGTGRGSQSTGITIDDSNNLTGVVNLGGQTFSLTVNQALSASPGFYYTDFIQNGFSATGSVVGDPSNLFTGVYWKSNQNFTKNAGGYGLTGTMSFLWNQGTQFGKMLDGGQAAAGVILNNGSRYATDVSCFRAFLSNAGIITEASFFAGEANSYIGAGSYTTIKGYKLKAGAISAITATNKYCLAFDDTSPSYMMGSLGIGTSTPSVKLDVQDNVNGALQASVFNNSTGTSAYTQLFVGSSYLLHLGDNYTDPNIAGTGILHGDIMLTIESDGDTVFANGGDYSDIKFRMDTNGNLRAYYLHNNATAHGDSTEQDIRSGDYNAYTPTPSNSTNTDSAVTVAGGIFCRIGNWVDVKMEFTADPTLTATTTSFEVSLPITSNLVQTYDLVGHAVCGSIAGMSAQVMGEVTNNTAKISWVSTDITSQTWSLSFGYIVK